MARTKETPRLVTNGTARSLAASYSIPQPQSTASLQNGKYLAFRELVRTSESGEGKQMDSAVVVSSSSSSINNNYASEPPRKQRRIDTSLLQKSSSGSSSESASPVASKQPSQTLPHHIFLHNILPFCPKSSLRLVSKQVNKTLLQNQHFLKAYLWTSLNGLWFRYDYVDDSYFALLNERCELGLSLSSVERICQWEAESKHLFAEECLWLFRRLQQLNQADEALALLFLSITFETCTEYPIRPIVIDLDEALEEQEFVPMDDPDNLTMEDIDEVSEADLERSICMEALNHIVRFPEYELHVEGTESYDEHWARALELNSSTRRYAEYQHIPKIIEAHKQLKADCEQRYKHNCVVKYYYRLAEGRDLWLQLGVKTIGGRRFMMGFAVERYDY